MYEVSIFLSLQTAEHVCSSVHRVCDNEVEQTLRAIARIIPNISSSDVSREKGGAHYKPLATVMIIEVHSF